MSGKQEIIRALDNLAPDSLDQVKVFLDTLKKTKKNGQRISGNPAIVAKKQCAAIKKWAGKKLPSGFSGRDHDRVLYGAK
jgi:hypothetical protein